MDEVPIQFLPTTPNPLRRRRIGCTTSVSFSANSVFGGRNRTYFKKKGCIADQTSTPAATYRNFALVGFRDCGSLWSLVPVAHNPSLDFMYCRPCYRCTGCYRSDTRSCCRGWCLLYISRVFLLLSSLYHRIHAHGSPQLPYRNRPVAYKVRWRLRRPLEAPR